MQWFRMYAEYATDPKVQSMDETLQRRFVMFLCLQCNGEFERLSDDELACALRISTDELLRSKEIFRSKGFIDDAGKISNWNKRQYKSDDVSTRVKKHREQKKKRPCNVTVTPSDTDSDTDSERNKKPPSEAHVPQKRDGGPTERIFEHWRSEYRHPKANLDAKRRRLIQRALEAYDEPTLCQSISGYKFSPHHMGQNEQRTVYDDIELFLRDAKHVDMGLQFARAPPAAPKSAVEAAREKLQSRNGHARVISEQFGRESEPGVGEAPGALRRLAAP